MFEFDFDFSLKFWFHMIFFSVTSGGCRMWIGVSMVTSNIFRKWTFMWVVIVRYLNKDEMGVKNLGPNKTNYQ